MIKEGKAEIVRDSIKDWAAMERNELITSMLDGYSEEEYTKLKEAAEVKP